MRFKILAGIAVLMLLGTFFQIAAPVSAAPTRITLPFVITTDTVYPKGEYDMTYHLTIRSGARVTFEAGSTIRVSNMGIYAIDVRGELYLEGSQSDPVTIMTDAATPLPGAWVGIQYQTGSSGAVNHTNIKYAANGLWIYFGSDVSVSHSLFNNCSGAGIFFSNFQNTLPEDVVVEYTDFTDNNVGIRENGRRTLIDHCTFSDSTYYGVEMGQGDWPISDGCRVIDSTFRDSGYEDILLNTTDDDPGISNVTVDGCKFSRHTGYDTYNPFISSPGTIIDLNLTRNTFYRSNRERGIILSSAVRANISRNRIYSFDGEYYSEKMFSCYEFSDLTIWKNTFYGPFPYRGNVISINAANGEGIIVQGNMISEGGSMGMRIDNSTHVRVIGNVIENPEYGINIRTCADVAVEGNTVSKSIRETYGGGIVVSGAIFKVFETTVIVSNNRVSGFRSGIDVNTNGENILMGNGVVDCRSGYGIEGLNFGVEDPSYHETAVVENCTAENITGTDLDISGYHVNVTVRAVNCSMNMSRIDMEVMGPVHHGDLFWSSYLRGAVSNEIGERETFDMDIRDESSSPWYCGTYGGVSPLIEGPPIHYFHNWTDGMYIVDPYAALLNCTLRTDSGSHQGMVNLTSYTLIDVIIDHRPVFSSPSPIHFDEDTVYSLNLSRFFSDLDPVSYDVLYGDDNLTAATDEVTNTLVNWTGEGNVTFRATDSMGNFTDGIITFIVDPVQDAPEMGDLPDNFTMDEDTTTWINLSRFMFDADGDPLTWTYESDANLSCAMDGSTWNLTISPLENWNGEAVIRLFLNDTIDEVNATLSVLVKPVNDPPVFDVPADWNITVKRGEITRFNISDMVSDIDDSELMFSTDSEYVSIQNGELIVLFPEGTNHTISSVNIRVEDPWGGLDIATLMIYIEDGGSGGGTENWTLQSASVTISGDGSWEVSCRGSPGQSVFIMIEGVGSFPLSEDPSHPGDYSATIDSGKFKDDMTYPYHFSDREGGPVLAPDLSGSIHWKEPEGSVDGSSLWILVAILSLCLLVMLVVIIGLARSRRGEKALSEE